jgi:galactokinase
MKKYFAPGRVNFIGEHLDYNGGLVMPFCINSGIEAIVTERNDNHISLSSSSHIQNFTFDINNLPDYDKTNEWSNYCLGVIKYLKSIGIPIPSVDIKLSSTLPEGSGLSSSAALEVLIAFIILSESNTTSLSRKDIAVLCQKVENDFIGVKCGIMDQYAIANGKENFAILLDCEKIEHEMIPMDLDDYKILILNTNKPRSLIKSAYNERKASCDESLDILKGKYPIESLAKAEIEMLSLLQDEVLLKRSKHVVSEQMRVKHIEKYLENGDLYTVGKLLTASHFSLRDNYEVSCVELDTLVNSALSQEGCIGARMTGAGFGGCAIALVKSNKIEKFKEKVKEEYYNSTSITCDIIETKAEEGVRRIY